MATCDRLKSYWWIKRLQWCWAHLRRDFQAMIDRGGSGKAIGERLLAASNTMFALWHQYKEGKRTRRQWQRAIQPIRQAIQQTLEDGQGCGCDKTAGTCKELHKHREWLWTFLEVDGVEPTNNASERALRHAVIWRKLSFGTQSAHGSRFVATILTVVETCRQQSRSVFEYLTIAMEAHFAHESAPSLLPRA